MGTIDILQGLALLNILAANIRGFAGPPITYFMPHLFWTAWLSAILLTCSACGAGWHRITPPEAAQLPVRRQVQVWHTGGLLRLHAVRSTGDSVSGVPYLKAPTCDSCRVSVPWGEVDSLRTGSPEAGFLKSMGVVASVVGGITLYLAAKAMQSN